MERGSPYPRAILPNPRRADLRWWLWMIFRTCSWGRQPVHRQLDPASFVGTDRRWPAIPLLVNADGIFWFHLNPWLRWFQRLTRVLLDIGPCPRRPPQKRPTCGQVVRPVCATTSWWNASSGPERREWIDQNQGCLKKLNQAAWGRNNGLRDEASEERWSQICGPNGSEPL